MLVLAPVLAPVLARVLPSVVQVLDIADARLNTIAVEEGQLPRSRGARTGAGAATGAGTGAPSTYRY